MSIGDRIKILREREGISQMELAQKININNSVLSRIEANDRQIRDDEILSIAQYFGVTTDYLLGTSINPTPKNDYYINEDTAELAQEIFENPDLKILMSASRKLKKEDLETLVKLVSSMKKE